MLVGADPAALQLGDAAWLSRRNAALSELLRLAVIHYAGHPELGFEPPGYERVLELLITSTDADVAAA